MQRKNWIQLLETIKFYSLGEKCERSSFWNVLHKNKLNPINLFKSNVIRVTSSLLSSDWAAPFTPAFSSGQGTPFIPILSYNYITKQKSHFWLLIWSIATIPAFLSQKQKKEQNVLKFLIWASMCLKKVKSEPGGVLSHVLKKMAISAWVCL